MRIKIKQVCIYTQRAKNIYIKLYEIFINKVKKQIGREINLKNQDAKRNCVLIHKAQKKVRI